MNQFSRNLAANLASHAGILLLQLWYTKILYQDLGPGLYGLVPLVTGLVFYLGLVTSSVSTATRRHLTVAMAEGDIARARSLLGVAIKSLAVLSIPLLMIGCMLILLLPSLIDIPHGMEMQARFLSGSVLFSFLVAQISVPFGAATFAMNRLDVRGTISLGENLIRVTAVWVLFKLSQQNLYAVGISLCASSVLSLTATILIQNRIIPGYSPRLFGAWDGKVFREMIRTGGWITVNLVGGILMLGIDLLVINRTLGATEAGHYAPVLQLASGFRGAAGIVGSLFAPTLMTLHAKGDPSSTAAYSARSLRFFGILVSVPLGVTSGLAANLLHVWLGPSHQTSWILMVVLIGSLSVTLLEHPLNQVQLAANKVRIPAIATLVAGAVNALLAFQFCRNFGVFGVAVAGVLVLGMKTVVFTPTYNARILGTRVSSQIKGIGTSVTVFLLAFVCASVIGHMFEPGNMLALGMAAASSAALSHLAIYLMVLNGHEREEVVRSIGRFKGLVFRFVTP